MRSSEFVNLRPSTSTNLAVLCCPMAESQCTEHAGGNKLRNRTNHGHVGTTLHSAVRALRPCHHRMCVCHRQRSCAVVGSPMQQIWLLLQRFHIQAHLVLRSSTASNVTDLKHYRQPSSEKKTRRYRQSNQHTCHTHHSTLHARSMADMAAHSVGRSTNSI